MDAPSLTVLVMYPVGSRYEPEKLSGVSHYIEHLMFKGTKKRKNTLVLTREIDRLGAEYNAFTSKEYTGYYIKIDTSYQKIAIDILSDMLYNSVFDPKEMEREKGPIVEEIRMYRDNPLMNIDNVFEDLLYAGCPMGRDIAGTPEHVLGYKRADVLSFRDKYYVPSNMTVVVAGGEVHEVENLVEQYFGKQHSEKKPSSAFKAAAFGSGTKAKRLDVRHKQTDQAQLMIGFPGFSYTDSRNPSVAVMNTILGGSMSSRLFIQIRERRGLAYMVRSGSEKYRDTGYAYVRAGLEAKNINKAIDVIQKEIEKLKSKGVSSRELADAKTHIRGSLTLSMEDSSVQANWYAKHALFGETIETPEDRLKKIDAVKKDDILKIVNKLYVWNKARIAIIGNVDKSEIHY